MKIALALIVKGDDKEAELLSRCLNYSTPFVDGVFITITHKQGEEINQKVKETAEIYSANVSYFEWVNDFSKARNFNFSQVPKEYTHILWLDADDVPRGLENLKEILEENPMIDCFSMNYLYDFDEDKNPTVVHQKTRIIKNNGSVEWAGQLHEDFKENRIIRRTFIKNIEVLHLTNEKRIEIGKQRNVEVAKLGIEESPDDPRSWWNYGNSLLSAGKFNECIIALEKFLTLSSSDEEKYLSHLRISAAYNALGQQNKAIDNGRYAIGIKPEYPDAYHHMGRIYFAMGLYEKARDYFLLGLTKRPPVYSIIVYNPRDYDYNPLLALGKTYFALSLPIQALECLKGCYKISKGERLEKLIKQMKKEAKKFELVMKEVKKLKKIENKDKLLEVINKIPKELRNHPAICLIKNTHFIKTESSGKDLVFYCGYTEEEWTPDVLKKRGIGGSEEAVINLSQQLAELGWNVTVYANCGYKEKMFGKVLWKPFWDWNFRDKQDVVVLWRSPGATDYGINCDKVIVDIHDVIGNGEFTEERLSKIYKVFFKTKAHRDLYENVSDDKAVIIPNGMDFGLFNQEVKKDQYLMVNTSSPERSLGVLPELFKKIKEIVPEAKLKWAYGWKVFDIVHGENENMMEWKNKVIKEMEEVGIENLNRVPQQEAAKLYLEANILAYPTEFFEIDCITVKKAQACGCIPITTDFAALNESVQYGIKIHSNKTKENWSKDKFEFGLEDENAKNEWVEACIKQLQTPIEDRTEMKEWAKKFAWNKIANQWNEVIKNVII